MLLFNPQKSYPTLRSGIRAEARAVYSHREILATKILTISETEANFRRIIREVKTKNHYAKRFCCYAAGGKEETFFHH
jgi:hypothetical protein